MDVLPGSRFTAPIRLGLLTPYNAFFEQRFPPDFRASQQAYADALAEQLATPDLAVTRSGLVHDSESAAVASARFADAAVEVVVVAATMAAAPTFGAEALRAFTGPIVIWNDKRVTRFASDVDEVEATRTSGLLGSVMLANVLGRQSRRFVVASAVESDPTEVIRAVRGAGAAAALRGARLGLLGGTIPGYGDVILEPETAEALGIVLVPIEREAVKSALRVAGEASDARPLPDVFELTPSVAPLLGRSLRAHRLLEAVARDSGLDALALNCHSDVLRWNEDLGVVACLGSTLLWSQGIPVTCTGDAATAVALMLAARIDGTAQYCEGYAVETETGELMVSSCGMADISLCPPEARVALHPNELYPGANGLGVAARFDFRAGPATIAAFAPGSQGRASRLVAASGELTGRGFAQLNGPSGTFALEGIGRGGVSNRLIEAAPAHHLALIKGDRSVEVRTAATFLDVEFVDLAMTTESLADTSPIGST